MNQIAWVYWENQHCCSFTAMSFHSILMQAGNCLSLLELFNVLKVLWADRWKWHSHYWSFLLLIYCRVTLALCTCTECCIWVIYECFVSYIIFSCELCRCIYLNVFGVYRHSSPKNGNSVTCSHVIPNFFLRITKKIFLRMFWWPLTSLYCIQIFLKANTTLFWGAQPQTGQYVQCYVLTVL